MSGDLLALNGSAFWQKVPPRPAPRAVRRSKKAQLSAGNKTGTVLLLCPADDPQRHAFWRFLRSVLADGVSLIELAAEAGRDVYTRAATVPTARAQHVVVVMRDVPDRAVDMAFAWFGHAVGAEHVTVLGESRHVLDDAPPGAGFIALSNDSNWQLPLLGALRRSGLPIDTSQLQS